MVVQKATICSACPLTFCQFVYWVSGQGALEAGELRGGDSTYFNRTIVILLHLVCLLTKLIPHLEKEKVYGVKQAFYEFVMGGAKGRGGSSPLHLTCSRETSSVPSVTFPQSPPLMC